MLFGLVFLFAPNAMCWYSALTQLEGTWNCNSCGATSRVSKHCDGALFTPRSCLLTVGVVICAVRFLVLCFRRVVRSPHNQPALYASAPIQWPRPSNSGV